MPEIPACVIQFQSRNGKQNDPQSGILFADAFKAGDDLSPEKISLNKYHDHS
jgi:hypothetical protein